MRFFPILIAAISLQSTVVRAQPRFGLVARDNGPLELVRHDVQVRINHPLAETTVTQEFANPTSMSLEAYYYYPLPSDATVAGLTLWVNGVRREARMLERQRAREIYQGIVNQKRDPALVERLSGNLFRIRIFPVLPKRRCRVELRFVQLVDQPAADQYRFTVRRPPGPEVRVLRLGVRLSAGFELVDPKIVGFAGALRQAPDRRIAQLVMPAEQRRFTTDIHLFYSRKLPMAPVVAASSHGGKRTFVAEVPWTASTAKKPRRVVVLVDRSRSTKVVWAKHDVRQTVGAVISKLSRRDEVAVVPFDLLPRAPGFRLREKGGAANFRPAAQADTNGLSQPVSDLGTAYLPAFRGALRHGPTHVVLITDGGDRYHQAELEKVRRLLYDRKEVCVSVLALGLVNDEALRDIARLTSGVYIHHDQLDELTWSSRPPVVRQDGAQLLLLRHEPRRLLIAGQIAEDAAQAPLGITIDGKQVSLSIRRVREDKSARQLWAAGRIARLTDRIKLFGEEPSLASEIVSLSKQHNVVSEYTALLVTETDADYNRQTSGRRWQRQLPRVGDNLPAAPLPKSPFGFHSTPEPHEYAMIFLAVAMLFYARRRGWLDRPT